MDHYIYKMRWYCVRSSRLLENIEHIEYLYYLVIVKWFKIKLIKVQATRWVKVNERSKIFWCELSNYQSIVFGTMHQMKLKLIIISKKINTTNSISILVLVLVLVLVLAIYMCT